MRRALSSLTRQERIKADLILLLVAIVWGSAFVAQRVAALNLGVYWFNGLRFLTGALILLPFARNQKDDPPGFSLRHLLGISLAGVFLFSGTSFQQAGLRFTTAGNAGFITGLYVVIIPLILALGFKRRPRRHTWVAAIMAALGLFLLSTGGQLKLNPGDALELGGALMWALHVIWIGYLVRWVGVLPLAIGQYLVCGLLSLGVALATEAINLQQLYSSGWTVAYTGVLSIGLGYTLQAVAQKIAPATDAAIILSTEAAFAALFGWLTLGESLTALQLAGCALMLGGMILAQIQGWSHR
jgi:drug/metabolite transporter (DMT)-like permease